MSPGGLSATAALPLLDRLRRSNYGGDWLRGAMIGLEVGDEQVFCSTSRVMPYAGEALDTWIVASSEDVAAMLAGAAPPGQVGFRLGGRDDAAPRIKQARAVMALAALGWAGPWPDPEADAELHALTRRAVLDLALGANDGLTALFPPSAPSELAAIGVRLTDGARPKRCTLGLSDAPGGPEFWTDGPTRNLRFAALHWLEVGSIPGTLEIEGGELRFTSTPLPLPLGLGRLVRVEGGRP